MSSAGRTTVLVVDDEPDVADAYAAQLEDLYDVITAYSGEAALDALDADVDVVLLDRRMPEVSGDDVLARIRERDLDTRVAMVTAIDPDFDIIEMPFDDYVVKPAVRRDLVETIERMCNCVSYEKRMREYFRLTSKYAALKATKPASELEESSEFRELQARIDAHRAELDEVVSSFDEDDYVAVFRDLEASPVAPDGE